MAVTSTRTVQIDFSGDVAAYSVKSALANDASPGMVTFQDLASGPNVITAPVVTDVVVTALTIIPPSANTVIVTLKGVAGDTGFPLNIVDPTSIAIDPTFVSLVLSAASAVDGFQLIWS